MEKERSFYNDRRDAFGIPFAPFSPMDSFDLAEWLARADIAIEAPLDAGDIIVKIYLADSLTAELQQKLGRKVFAELERHSFEVAEQIRNIVLATDNLDTLNEQLTTTELQTYHHMQPWILASVGTGDFIDQEIAHTAFGPMTAFIYLTHGVRERLRKAVESN